MSNGPGSKPAALHTEYAQESVGGPAYGTQDLVFYLLRADSDSAPSGLEQTEEQAAFGDDVQFQSQADIPGDVYNQATNNLGALGVEGATGFAPEMGSVQSGASQISMGAVGRSLGGTTPSGYSMGPMSGMDYDTEEKLGAISQNASLSVDIGESVRNALRSVDSLDSQVTNLSMASSEKMFNGILRRNYQRESLDEETGTEESILGSLDRPPTAELAFLLARASGGVTRVRDLVAGINDGSIGLVTPKSRAFQERMGPNGAPRRR